MRRAPRNLLIFLILILFGIGVATVIKRRGDETNTASGPGATTTTAITTSTTRPATSTTPTTSVAGQVTTTSVAGQATTTSVAGQATTTITRSTLATTTTVPGATTTTTLFGATTTTPTIVEHPNTGGGNDLGPGLGFLVAGIAGLGLVHRRRPPPKAPAGRPVD